MPVYLIGGLAVQVAADTGIDLAELGGLAAVYFASSLVFSVTAGRVVRSLGVRRTVQVTAAVSTATLLTIAGLGRDVATLSACMVAAGFANGTAQPAVNQMIARHVRSARRGLIFGIKQSAIPLGGLLGGLAVPVIGLTVGWRWAFVLAVLTPVAAVLLMPRGEDGPVGGDGTRPGASAPAGRRRGLLVVATGAGFANASTMMLGTFFVTSAVATGTGPASAGLLLSVGSLVGIVARILSGVMADRRGTGHLRRVQVMFVIAAVGFVLLAVGGHPLTLLPGAVLAFAAGWGWHGLLVHAVVDLHPEDPATATAMTQAGTYAGGIAGPALFGILSASLGFSAGWLLAAGSTLVGGVLLHRGSRSHEGAKVGAG